MRNRQSRRFGAHEASGGKIQIPTARYNKYSSELEYLHLYLTSRLLPTEPEEILMQGVLSNLENLFEHEAEESIRTFVKKGGNEKERKFLHLIETGYVTFKTKYDWLLARSLIKQSDWDVMDTIRVLRNKFIHTRPIEKRRRFKYQGFALLTQRSTRKLLVDAELTLRRLRKNSGRKSTWMTVPPGYAEEMGWPKEYISALNGVPAEKTLRLS